MEDIIFNCERCGAELIISKDARGDIIRCSSCNEKTLVKT